MKNNSNLHAAKAAKNDEFYTRFEDVEQECSHYSACFRDAVVVCNCDDPFQSAFAKYFLLNFEKLGLKKLVCSCFGEPLADGQQLSFFDSYEGSGKACMAVIDKPVPDYNRDGKVDVDDVMHHLRDGGVVAPLKGNGDFRSAECREALRDDNVIVCTNPPFSLWREFLQVLTEENVKFLIVGSGNAAAYKRAFNLFRDEKMWLGYNRIEKFDQPDGRGKVMTYVSWFTNLGEHHYGKPLPLTRSYSPEKYPKYDNYDAIEVNKVADIPKDFYGIMGVPSSFLHKFCPEQFVIVGGTNNIDLDKAPRDFFRPPSMELQKKYRTKNRCWVMKNPYLLVDGCPKSTFYRIFIRRVPGSAAA